MSAAATAVAVAAPPAAEPPPPDAIAPTGVPLGDVSPDYRLDTDDAVTINVMRHTYIAGTFKIPPDGLLRLPRLVTPVMARGKTCSELADEITGKLKTEGKLVLRPGQVSVTPFMTRKRRVLVRGNAVGGREYELQNGWRIADLVAYMGSIPQPDRVKARLTSPRRPEPLVVNLNAALADPTSSANILLQEGDTLTVEMPRRKRLLITGEAPRGEREFDDWVGLKRALLAMGFTAYGGASDLANARLIRYAVPGDLSSQATYIPVNLQKLLTEENAAEIPFEDMDTLDIPLSEKHVFIVGQVNGIRKWYPPQDRKTYLVDVFTTTGDVNGRAAIGRIKLLRKDPKTGEWREKEYDLGKFYSKADYKQNPEVLPMDMIYVPANNKTDVVGNVWTAFGLYNLMKTFVPGLR
jgi:protein involved in polysaccharide export with SLBB domain